jgi:hypothetical protein
MKAIVAGSRTFHDYNRLNEVLSNCEPPITEVVSGTAPGADRLGEVWANKNNIPITRFPANWGKFGKGAGLIRNEAMAKYAEVLYAFWDGESKGTANMIEQAYKHNMFVRIIRK